MKTTRGTVKNNNNGANKQKNNFARAAHFFVQFARRKRETSFNFLVTRFMDETCVPVHSVFSLPLIFTLVAASISHFLTAVILFSCFSSNEIGLRCHLFLALTLFPLSKLM